MFVSGIEVYPVNIECLSDKDPVYIVFDEGSPFISQWGIVDRRRKATIHKDFVITFSDKCRYYGLNRQDTENNKKENKKGVIVKF